MARADEEDSGSDGETAPSKSWFDAFLALATRVPAALTAITLMGLAALWFCGERLSSGNILGIVALVGLVSIAYFLLAALKGERRRRERAEDDVAAKKRRLDSARRSPTPADQVWSRVAITLDLTEDTLMALRKRLDAIHSAAFTRLSGAMPRALEPKQVRVNIMLPDNRRARYGDVCILFIPRKLHVQMEGAPDRHIRFSLTQGLVGKVFSENRAGGARVDGGQWRRVFLGQPEPADPGMPDFELTAWQSQLLHPELRWILAFPLLYPEVDGQARALGVLNIDGIGFDLTQELFLSLHLQLVEQVTIVAIELMKLRKQRLSITQQEIPHDHEG